MYAAWAPYDRVVETIELWRGGGWWPARWGRGLVLAWLASEDEEVAGGDDKDDGCW